MQLCKSLHYSNFLYTLNLSDNKISDKGSEWIAEMLILNISIKQLFLHWNLIWPAGGNTLFKAISLNQYVLSFDISFNSLGQKTEKHNINKGLHQFCIDNKTLIHLDLSFNNFNHD